MKKIKTRLRFAVSIIKYLFARTFSPLLCRLDKYKDLWVVSERGVDARDNGYHFFAYLMREHPEINAVYIISKDSPDYPKVAQLGRIIRYRSFSHYIALACAKALVSTHICGYTPDMYLFGIIDKYIPFKGKKIFLQHGIIKDDLKELYYPNVRLDVFVCGANPEYEYIKENYCHPDGVVQYLGLCRYDALYSALQEKRPHSRQLLFMPTWRLYLQHCASAEDFIDSDYYKMLSLLLSSRKLEELLEKYDYTLVFYPHFESQRFLEAFISSSPRVIIADFSDFDVQTLLIDSAMLITDYSSVFFDNAYLRKSVLYLQCDEENYRAQHYKKGYFDYRANGFGAVCTTVDELLENLEKMLETDCAAPEFYVKRIESFFTRFDNKNCERNFEAVHRLL
ncbi:MAG: CDP-glycerol glycerophosphotransferase family protein [Clostridia bacterium]|nr:CDP-glycerol glycerophosphotransferase family protein [Clostridia bacterium]